MQKLILVAWLAAGAAGEEVVWIEAEQFQSHGGWTNDAQFIDQMGSPYLLADRAGHAGRRTRSRRVRVAARRDASGCGSATAIGCRSIIRAGSRCRSTGRRWERVFGASGQPRLALGRRRRTRTGRPGGTAAARPDRLLRPLRRHGAGRRTSTGHRRTTGRRSRPSASEHGGVSREVRDLGEYDVVVVGGGLAGCTAAVAAARQGVRRVADPESARAWAATPARRSWSRRSASGRTASGSDRSIRARRAWSKSTAPRATSRCAKGDAVFGAPAASGSKLEPNLDLYLNTHATGVECSRRRRRGSPRCWPWTSAAGQRLRFRRPRCSWTARATPSWAWRRGPSTATARNRGRCTTSRGRRRRPARNTMGNCAEVLLAGRRPAAAVRGAAVGQPVPDVRQLLAPAGTRRSADTNSAAGSG